MGKGSVVLTKLTVGTIALCIVHLCASVPAEELGRKVLLRPGGVFFCKKHVFM